MYYKIRYSIFIFHGLLFSFFLSTSRKKQNFFSIFPTILYPEKFCSLGYNLVSLMVDPAQPMIPELISMSESWNSAERECSSTKENVPFQIETYASEYAITATLFRSGRPFAFFTTTPTKSVQCHASTENKAYATVEVQRKLRHYFIQRHFRLVTDQNSVVYV